MQVHLILIFQIGMSPEWNLQAIFLEAVGSIEQCVGVCFEHYMTELLMVPLPVGPALQVVPLLVAPLLAALAPLVVVAPLQVQILSARTKVASTPTPTRVDVV